MKFLLQILISLMIVSIHFASASTLQFVVIGDTGKNNDGQKMVAHALSRHCQTETCHFGLLAGDNVYEEGMTSVDDPIMDRVFRDYYSQLNFPFFVALGNHDYGRWSNNWTRGAYQLEYAKRNPQFLLPRFYYYKEFEDMVLVVLDTTRMMWEKDLAEQEKMIQEAYLRSRGKWFIVMGHHPYLSNGKHGNAGQYEGLSFPSFVSGKYVKAFLEKNVCGKAQIYVSGHDHNLQLIDGRQKNCTSLLLVSGAGASSTELEGRNNAYFASESLGFSTLVVNKETIDIRFFDQNNRNIYQGRLNLPNKIKRQRR